MVLCTTIFTHQPHLVFAQKDSEYLYRWENVNENFIMPIDLLVNGRKIRVFPTKNFQSLSISKHSQIEIMDWKFYVKPVEKK